MYRLPLTKSALLSLQDNHGLDANLLLFCCWYAHTRGRLDAATAQAAVALSEPLANYVVRPLRSARRWLKLNPAAEDMAVVDPTIPTLHQHLYEQVKTLELQAEQLQEKMLEALLLVAEQSLASQLPSRDNQVMDAVHNHQILLEASDITLNEEMDGLLATLVTATLFTPVREETE